MCRQPCGIKFELPLQNIAQNYPVTSERQIITADINITLLDNQMN
jgi:hypothetical protein